MAGRCKHENADHLMPGDRFSMSDFDFEVGKMVDVEQFRCIDCGAWLSIGPSNDTPEAVQIEIRAAEIAQEVSEMTEWWLYVGINSTEDENRGYSHAKSNVGPDINDWEAGYLARVINSPTSGDGE